MCFKTSKKLRLLPCLSFCVRLLRNMLSSDLNELLDQHGLLDDIYDAIGKEDSAEAVMAAYRGLKKIQILPDFVREGKCEKISETKRLLGNHYFHKKEFRLAFEAYNEALVFAPKHSSGYIQVLGNRSALFFQINQYHACVRDIDDCIRLGCPQELLLKLTDRRKKAVKHLNMKSCKNVNSDNIFFIKDPNTQIPCASKDVEVVMESESQIPVIVASKNLNVGTVVAIEEPYVSFNYETGRDTHSCYYCHKMSLNMIPCDNCCSALFCNALCKDLCNKEYHDIDCKMSRYSSLSVIAMLKLKGQCSWEDFIEASHVMGRDRLRKSTAREAYDRNQKFSILTFNLERHFLFGKLYNGSFDVAMILYILDQVSFFPETSIKQEARKAVARVLVYLEVHAIGRMMETPTQLLGAKILINGPQKRVGLFPFIGKLRRSCNPNVLAVSLNKRMALVVLKPIKKGSSLTTFYLDNYWTQCNMPLNFFRNMMFTLYGITCKCAICRDGWTTTEKITHKHEKYLIKQYHVAKKQLNEENHSSELFRLFSKTLGMLNDVVQTDEYVEVFDLFKKCLMFYQNEICHNVLVDHR